MAVGAYFAWYPRDTLRVYGAGTLSIPEAASLTIKRGTPVVIDTNGRIDAAATAFTSVFGVAAEDGHNGTAGQFNILVYQIRQYEQWCCPLLEALTQTLHGDTELGFVKDATTGFWYASTADAGAQARLVDYVQGPAGMVIGDTKAPVFVEFHGTKLQVV